MKVNKLESHDRLQHLKKDQSANVLQGAEDCLKRNSLSLALQEKSPYIYIFAHPRTMDDGVTKALYWQPRLSRPKAQTNSYLFRVKSKTDEIEVCWLIPPREMWNEYIVGKVTGNELIDWSIKQFRFKREELERADPDDLSEEKGSEILNQVLQEHKQQVTLKKNLDAVNEQIQSGVIPFKV